MWKFLNILILIFGVSSAQFSNGFPFNVLSYVNTDRLLEQQLNTGDKFLREWQSNPANQRLQEKVVDNALKQQDEFAKSIFSGNSPYVNFPKTSQILQQSGSQPSNLVQLQKQPYYEGYKVASNPYTPFVKNQFRPQ